MVILMILMVIPLESLGIGPKILGFSTPVGIHSPGPGHLVVGQDGARASVQVCLGPAGYKTFSREQLLSFWNGSTEHQWKITIAKSWECPFSAIFHYQTSSNLRPFSRLLLGKSSLETMGNPRRGRPVRPKPGTSG